MSFECTPAVSRALGAARRWAAALDLEQTEPKHILLGLLDEEEGRAARILVEHEILLTDVRKHLSGTISSTPPETDSPAGDGCSESLLAAARWNAMELAGEKTIAGEHLLLALAEQDDECRVCLEEFGLTARKLRDSFGVPAGQPIELDEPLELAPPVEQVDSARILDANINRSREALRVIEEYARFILNDQILTGRLKELRHRLQKAVETLSQRLLLESRDTSNDVGTDLSLPTEAARQTTQAVLSANMKRLQESLRSLEEYGKISSSLFGQEIESIRYETYVLEKAMLMGAAASERLADISLCVLVGGALCTASVEWTVREAIDGGVQMIQLREKNRPDKVFLERSREVREITRQKNVIFIVNDRPDIARLVGADGVHLGQDDQSIAEARRILGPNAIVGISTHDINQLQQAVLDGATYLGIGPTFASGTKDFVQLAGLEYVSLAARETRLPTFAIGGITLENVDQVIASGLARVAVSGAICKADEPQMAARRFRSALDAV